MKHIFIDQRFTHLCDESEELIRENFDQYLVSRIRTKNNLNVFVAHTHHLNLS